MRVRCSDAQQLKRRDDAVARGVVVVENDVSGSLSAKHRIVCKHPFKNVAITDIGNSRFDVHLFHGGEEAEVAHDGRDDFVVFEEAALFVLFCADRNDLVAGKPALIQNADF